MSEINNTPIDIDVAAPNTIPLSESLHSEIITDESGFEREVYRVGDRSIVFKGREEVPVIPGFEDAVVAGNTELPRFTESALTSGNDETKIIANQTPLGVVEVALLLGASEKLQHMREELERGVYSADSLSLIDDIMACRLVDGEGKLQERVNSDAEMLVILSLLGDETARGEVATRRTTLDQYDMQHMHTESKQLEGEVLNPDNVLLVRRTGVKPEIAADGRVLLRSTADTTGGKYVRNTIHFSLDVPVVSHMSGNWDDQRYTIVDTLGSVLAENGKRPANLASNDTWFDQNPGEALVLPTARIFEANEQHVGEPEETGSVTVYNPSTHDIRKMIAQERHRRGVEDPGSISEHGWSTDSNKTKKLHNLALTLAVPQKDHIDGAEIKLGARLGSMLADADDETDSQTRKDNLFSGDLRIDWRKLATDVQLRNENGQQVNDIAEIEPEGPVPHWLQSINYQLGGRDSLNALLVNCSKETRRNFYASGLSLPRVRIVSGKSKQLTTLPL